MKRMPLLVAVLMVGVSVFSTATAAELGRKTVTPDPQGKIPKGGEIPVARGYQGSLIEAGPGLEVGVGWNSFNWEIGEDFKDNVWTPQIAAFYGVSDNIDLRATFKYVGAKGEENGVSGDISAFRVGLGSKIWFNLRSDFYPFVTASANYYILNVDEGDSEKGCFGVSGEAGVGYLLNDWVLIHAALQGETSINKGSVDIGNVSEDVKMNSLGLGLGLTVIF